MNFLYVLLAFFYFLLFFYLKTIYNANYTRYNYMQIVIFTKKHILKLLFLLFFLIFFNIFIQFNFFKQTLPYAKALLSRQAMS